MGTNPQGGVFENGDIRTAIVASSYASNINIIPLYFNSAHWSYKEYDTQEELILDNITDIL